LFRFGKRFGKPVDLHYVCGFCFHRLDGSVVLVQHEKSRKADYHAEHGSKRPLDLPEASGMRFAHFEGYPTLYEGCTRYRNQHNERNDQETPTLLWAFAPSAPYLLLS
jgi:hypothetical protein